MAVHPDGSRWRSVAAQRTVLAVVHNITSATRLLDLLSVFDGDYRVQTVATITKSSLLDNGTPEFLTRSGILLVPWNEATTHRFDLAITASRGGDLHRVRAPIIYTSHGAGYNKTLSRKPEAGSRKPEAGSRKPEAGSRKPEAMGLDDEWLRHDGRVVPSGLVLSHDEQLRRIERSCPEAVPISVVAGDLCMDRLWASRAFRADYRDALGVRDGQRLVVVSSTWGRSSLLAKERGPAGVLRAALAELPREDFRVLAAIHPNAWFGHGARQVSSWLAPLVDHGLIVPAPESETWKAALLAADCLIGDHGSLSAYGLALRLPLLLGAFDRRTVAAASPMATIGRVIRRYDSREPLLGQLEKAAAEQDGSHEVTRLRSLVSSRPGEAAAVLRRLFYGQLGLAEPATSTAPRPVPVPSAARGGPTSPLRPAVFAVAETTADPSAPGTRVVVRRYPAALQRDGVQRHVTGAHLVADIDDPDPGWRGAAGVLVLPRRRPLHAEGENAWWQALRAHPGAAVLAVAEPDDGALLLLRDGRRARAEWQGSRPWWASPDIAASVVHDPVALAGWDAADAAARWEVRTNDWSPPGRLVLTTVP